LAAQYTVHAKIPPQSVAGRYYESGGAPVRFQVVQIAVTNDGTITDGFTGNWFNASESGHGFGIEVLPNNQMLAEWFVFSPQGAPAWIVATGPITGKTAVLQAYTSGGSGAFFPPHFDPSHVEAQPWGTMTLTFSDCSNGQVSWQPTSAVANSQKYTSGTLPITRLTMPAGLTCP
jgi:hypothetical protein